MLKPVFLFVVGLVLLIKGGDWFVDGATGIARRFRIPEILIGATVVSIGTTLPEVMVSATSALGGHGEMAYGNAIGSIICNTALVAALTVAIKPSKTDRNALRLPVVFFFIAAVIYMGAAYALGEFSLWVGLVLLGVFAAYIAVLVTQVIREMKNKQPQGDTAEESREEGCVRPLYLEIVFLILGAVLIAVGADILVDNGTVIAKWLGVPESVIALTFIAIGTSLPELVTAITAIAKGHGALSLGNVIGANLFNLVLVSGTAATLSPFPVPEGNEVLGINSSLVIDLPVMLFVMAFLTVPAIIKGKLSRYQGVILVCVYLAFCVLQFVI